MNTTIPGIHHVTAITSDVQRNVDFYAGTLGLRLAKLTVNFDDPGAYHLYYGDRTGSPGTILTFFGWAHASRGRAGAPQATATALAVPRGSLAFWADRLREAHVATEEAASRWGDSVLAFSDPDGMGLEILASERGAGGDPWLEAGISEEHAIRGIDGVTLCEARPEATARLLADVMGYRPAQESGERSRLESSGGIGGSVDVLRAPGAEPGLVGAGSVHHVAFRTPGDGEQAAWRAKLLRLGLGVSPVMEREYFRSIYFREPGGVLFEIATDTPGFATDESVGDLGTRLMLPPWLESSRAQVEAALPPLRLPSQSRGAEEGA